MKKNKILISKALKKKLIIAAIIFLLPFFVVLSIVMMFAGGGTGNEENTIVQTLNIPYTVMEQVEKLAKEKDISFVFLLYNLALSYQETESYDKALPIALKNARTKILDDEEREFYEYFLKTYSDLEVGPIPLKNIISFRKKLGERSYAIIDTVEVNCSYTSTEDFGNDRTYGEVTSHEGNDLMAARNVPIVSITDGVITKKGWNEYGGYRVGVETKEGTYFYYAHMEKYAENIYEGKRINAGNILGFVGDSGQGEVGTTGQFPTHLHLQIGLKVEDKEDYLWIDPYNIVKYLDSKRTTVETTEDVNED